MEIRDKGGKRLGDAWSQRISLGRFGDADKFRDVNNPAHSSLIRIGSRNPLRLALPRFDKIGTDGRWIFNGVGHYVARDWLAGLERRQLTNLIVLTAKERELLLEVLVDLNVDIAVLEARFPIFGKVVYIPDARINFEALSRCMTKLHRLGIRGHSLGESESTASLFQVERKLRFKNGFDRYFALASHAPYQEVFKLKEERADRVVIALDFNSMYASCMRGDFLEPRRVRHVDFRDAAPAVEDLPPGLFRVVLDGARPGVFREIHPFCRVTNSQAFHFQLQGSERVELLLFRNEIVAYAPYFANIEIVEGLISDRQIRHPLSRRAERTYCERQHYKAQPNMLMEAWCKFRLASMHSATNRRRFKTRSFLSLDELANWLERGSLFDGQGDGSITAILRAAIQKRSLQIRRENGGYIARVLNFDDPENVFSLSAQIVANSRIRMVKAIERFLRHPSVELCYCNVDSLHLSIRRAEVEGFLEAHRDIISTRMGDLRVQVVADRGYWFDVGRYWLLQGREVALYRNKLFNRNFQSHPFARFRKVSLVRKGERFNYIRRMHFTMERSLVYNKKVVATPEDNSADFARFAFSEVATPGSATFSVSQEIGRSYLCRIELFNKIARDGLRKDLGNTRS